MHSAMYLQFPPDFTPFLATSCDLCARDGYPSALAPELLIQNMHFDIYEPLLEACAVLEHALAAVNASLRGAVDAVVAQELRAAFTDGPACDPAHGGNASLEVRAAALAVQMQDHPSVQALRTLACAPAVTAAVQKVQAAVLVTLNQTARGALNATHVHVLEQLVRATLYVPLEAQQVNCSDSAALLAAVEPLRLALDLELSAHPLLGPLAALPAQLQVQIGLTVRLGITEAQFDGEARLRYRTGVAGACGVHVSAVAITAVRVVQAGQARRLLQAAENGSLDIETTVMPGTQEAVQTLRGLRNSTALSGAIRAEMGAGVTVAVARPPVLSTVPPPPTTTPAPLPAPAARTVVLVAGPASGSPARALVPLALGLLLLVGVGIVLAVVLLRSEVCAPLAARPVPWLPEAKARYCAFMYYTELPVQGCARCVTVVT